MRLSVGPSTSRRCVSVVRCDASEKKPQQSRREFVLNANLLVVGSVLSIGATARPKNLGVQDYGSVKSLQLCPPTPNCIATSEEANDMAHYVPPWTYNPSERKNKITREKAIEELVSVVEKIKPDNFDSKIVKRTADYVYLEYSSPLLGFVDDVEFYFPPNSDLVEYRSASRVGESDFDINRKRIRSIRVELQKLGWKSVGF